MIRTSINIHEHIHKKIVRAARTAGTSQHDIIMRLIMRMMQHVDDFQGDFTTAKYQGDDPDGRWHCFTIRLRPDENEYCVDLRKVCKRSVSLILALAVEKYLDALIDSSNSVHNYVRFSNYVIRRYTIEGIICIQLCWGYPQKHLEKTLE